MNFLVVIPTYNERENIQNLIPNLLNLYPQLHILVVDDNSPDGTAKEVEQFQQRDSKRVHLLLRQQKAGLGKAYLAGFDWGLKRNYDGIIEMDADFSHRPADLARVMDGLRTYDFVIGSRYVDGGGTANWSWVRKLISRGGSLYARWILGFPLYDWTGGFNGWRKQTLDGLGLSRVRSEGYCFQIELKYRAMKYGFKGHEVPILFEDRRVGQSKMSLRIVLEAFYKVWVLRFVT